MICTSGQDVVARFGDRGEEYRALSLDIAAQLPKGDALREAAKRVAR